jgi:hypothetical protein
VLYLSASADSGAGPRLLPSSSEPSDIPCLLDVSIRLTAVDGLCCGPCNPSFSFLPMEVVSLFPNMLGRGADPLRQAPEGEEEVGPAVDGRAIFRGLSARLLPPSVGLGKGAENS